MPRKNEPSEKEVYKLWWEYFKSSPFCQAFWKWVKEKKLITGNHSLALRDPLPKQFQTKDGIIIIKYLLNWRDLLLSDGDEEAFENWWCNRRDKVIVDEYMNLVDSEFDFIRMTAALKLRRSPSFEEFKNVFKAHHQPENDPSRYLVSIDLTAGESIESIGKQVMSLIRKRRKDPNFRDVAARHSRGLDPTKPLHFEKIKHYLRVYNLRTKDNKKWREILEIIYPEIEKRLSDESISAKEVDRLLKKQVILERSLYKDFDNAKNIIKNVEKCCFPGNY